MKTHFYDGDLHSAVLLSELEDQPLAQLMYLDYGPDGLNRGWVAVKDLKRRPANTAGWTPEVTAAISKLDPKIEFIICDWSLAGALGRYDGKDYLNKPRSAAPPERSENSEIGGGRAESLSSLVNSLLDS